MFVKTGELVLELINLYMLMMQLSIQLQQFKLFGYGIFFQCLFLTISVNVLDSVREFMRAVLQHQPHVVHLYIRLYRDIRRGVIVNINDRIAKLVKQ